MDGVDGWGDDESDDEVQLFLTSCFDGCETVAELASALRALAEHIDQQAAAGWRLDRPVESGWADLRRTEVGR